MQTVRDWHSYVIRSTDRGKTWDDATFVVHTDEVSYVLLPGGKLLGFARVDTMYARDIWGVTGQTGEAKVTLDLASHVVRWQVPEDWP